MEEKISIKAIIVLVDRTGIQTVDQMKVPYVNLTEVGNCTGGYIRQ